MTTKTTLDKISKLAELVAAQGHNPKWAGYIQQRTQLVRADIDIVRKWTTAKSRKIRQYAAADVARLEAALADAIAARPGATDTQ